MRTQTCRLHEYPQQMRPRERMELFGVEKLTDVELLAILLATGDKERNVIELASQLLQIHKGITGLQDLSLEELMKQKGIGQAKATTIMASIELGKRIYNSTVGYRAVISSSEAAALLLQNRMRYLDREHFAVLLLNSAKAVISVETISIGTLDSSPVHPREVFKQAIRHSSSTIILAHNHPSGDCAPSQQDRMITERLVEAGKIIGIDVIDHIIIGEDNYYSFCENNLL